MPKQGERCLVFTQDMLDIFSGHFSYTYILFILKFSCALNFSNIYVYEQNTGSGIVYVHDF
jgi:hypothetical protein